MIVWLASYPRSGNTLLRTIIFHAFGIKTHSIYGDTDLASDPATKEIVGAQFLPRGWSEDEARRDGNLWLVKTHGLPANDDKAIYIIRDGRAALASYLHYYQSYRPDVVNLWAFINGSLWPCSWSDHVRGWNPLKRSNTLLLKFEDLAANPVSAMPVIAGFLGKPPVSRETPAFTDMHAVNPTFFRSGKTDSWKKEFSENQHFLFWLLYGDIMLEHGYRDKIPSLFDGGQSPATLDFMAAARDNLRTFLRDKEAVGVPAEEQIRKQHLATIQRQAEQISQYQGRLAQYLEEREKLNESAWYTPGTVVDFSERGFAIPYMRGGWSLAEPWGRWTDGNEAVLHFRFRKTPAADLGLSAVVRPFVVPSHPLLSVGIHVNGEELGKWELNVAEPVECKLIIPAAKLHDGCCEIAFRFAAPLSPATLGISGDTRQLGLGFETLVLQEEAN